MAREARSVVTALVLALLTYYPRLAGLAYLGIRRGGTAAAAERWSHWDRRHRPSPEAALLARIDYWTFHHLTRRWPLRTAAALLTLPVHAPLRALRYAATLGRAVRADGGPSIVVQLVDIWSLALRYPFALGSAPRLYYTQQLCRPEHRADAACVVSDLHHAALCMTINRGRAAATLRRAFERRCHALDLPHARAIARIGRDGSIDWLDDGAGLPPDDLFIKPERSGRGRGATAWERLPDGRYRGAAGTVLDGPALIDALRALAREGAIVVQPRLRNHPAVEACVGGALATVRVVTTLTAEGEFLAGPAVHRSATGSGAVDNFTLGGAVCAVRPESGTLGPAMWIAADGVRFAPTHPTTGAPIEGLRLPAWEEAMELVRRAHTEGFAATPVIGWDVALTPDGPVLVEANTVPGARTLQAAHRVPLGRQPYAARLLQLVEAAAAG